MSVTNFVCRLRSSCAVLLHAVLIFVWGASGHIWNDARGHALSGHPSIISQAHACTLSECDEFLDENATYATVCADCASGDVKWTMMKALVTAGVISGINDPKWRSMSAEEAEKMLADAGIDPSKITAAAVAIRLAKRVAAGDMHAAQEVAAHSLQSCMHCEENCQLNPCWTLSREASLERIVSMRTIGYQTTVSKTAPHGKGLTCREVEWPDEHAPLLANVLDFGRAFVRFPRRADRNRVRWTVESRTVFTDPNLYNSTDGPCRELLQAAQCKSEDTYGNGLNSLFQTGSKYAYDLTPIFEPLGDKTMFFARRAWDNGELYYNVFPQQTIWGRPIGPEPKHIRWNAVRVIKSHDELQNVMDAGEFGA